MTIIVCPGSLETVKEARELFGNSRVIAGAFREPIRITFLTEDEASFAIEYFEGQQKKVRSE